MPPWAILGQKIAGSNDVKGANACHVPAVEAFRDNDGLHLGVQLD
jgi:hypothetical protein